jgi:hypothetical protein
MTEFELIVECYRSGQMSEKQFNTHMEEPDFACWYLKQFYSVNTLEELVLKQAKQIERLQHLIARHEKPEPAFTRVRIG